MELKFSLFQTEKKNEKQPDYRGNVEIDGVPHSIAAWTRTDKNGKPYLSTVLQVDNYRLNNGDANKTAPKAKANAGADPFSPDDDGDPFGQL